MMRCGDNALTEAIATAARRVFVNLFTKKETYYYCALATTKDGHAPIVVACSWEGLMGTAIRPGNEELSMPELQWAIHESPYFNYGQEHFADVNRMFAERPSKDKLTPEAWGLELGIRLQSMEDALARLEREGLFARTQQHGLIHVLVDVIQK